jgi:hypothetical protein
MKLNRVMLLLILFVVLVLTAWATLWSQSAGQTAPAPAATLPAGTIVRLRTTEEIDSKHAKAGDTLPLEVMRDVKIGELLVIAKHTPVAATLTQVRRAPRGLRHGSLALEVKAVIDINGNPIAVSGTRRETGPGERQAEAYTEAVLSLGFLAPHVFFLHGDEAVVPRGSEIDPILSDDVVLNVSALHEREAALDAEAAATKEQSRTGQATVHLYLHRPWVVGQAHLHTHDPENHLVLVDGQKLVRLHYWNFYDAHIPPGHHVVSCNEHKLELDTKADEQYYVSIFQEHRRTRITEDWVPRLSDPDTGEEETYTLIPAGKKDVFSGQR